MILGIDTSLGTAVAVIEPDGVVRSSVASEDPRGHAEVIGTLIQRALAEAEATPSDITQVAAGMGPGPFTGLRVGIAAARAFALGGDGGRGIRFTPVVSHDAVAMAMILDAAVHQNDLGTFAVVTDARRRELAYTVYRDLDDDGLPARVTEPALAPRDELDGRLAELGATRLDASGIPASLIALAGARAAAAGRVVGPDDALYLRPPDVTPAKGPKRVTA